MPSLTGILNDSNLNAKAGSPRKRLKEDPASPKSALPSFLFPLHTEALKSEYDMRKRREKIKNVNNDSFSFTDSELPSEFKENGND